MGSVISCNSEIDNTDIIVRDILNSLPSNNLNFFKIKKTLEINQYKPKDIQLKILFNKLINIKTLPDDSTVSVSNLPTFHKYKYLHITIIENYYSYFEAEEELNTNKLFLYLIPIIYNTINKDEKIKLMSELFYKALDKHKSLSKFITTLRDFIYFYTKRLFVLLISEVKDIEEKNQLKCFYSKNLSNKNFNYNFNKITSYLINKYDGDIDLIEIKQNDIQEFILSYDITNIGTILSQMKIVQYS